jgi:hypothetical protein
MTAGTMDVYVEVGAKRTFAGAIDWPGWARSGRDEGAALGALLSSGERYARVLRGTRLGFRVPTVLADLRVVERLRGDAEGGSGPPATSCGGRRGTCSTTPGRSRTGPEAGPRRRS